VRVGPPPGQLPTATLRSLVVWQSFGALCFVACAVVGATLGDWRVVLGALFVALVVASFIPPWWREWRKRENSEATRSG
jgi:hypothetical protein